MAGETSEKSQRKGQAVNTKGEREQREEDGERKEPKTCNVAGKHKDVAGREKVMESRDEKVCRERFSKTFHSTIFEFYS